jgi:hypothetical protein
MKKIFVCTICILLAAAIPFAVCAAEPTEASAEAEGELSLLLSEKFESWVVPNIEEISVIITLVGTLFYQLRKNKLLSKSIGTMNNNAVAIAEQNAGMMSQALTGMESASLAVRGYEERIESLLEAYRTSAEDKARLEAELSEVKAYLKTASEANVEFANELAELLGLANIPNYKKEEIGARHLAAVRAIRENSLNPVQKSEPEEASADV